MINSVVKEIEGIRGRGESLFFRCIKSIVKFLVLSNLMVACGAFCFAYALSILLHGKLDLIFPCVTFLYIYAMHVLNRFLDRGASAYNDPERAAFLRKHRPLLIMTAVAAIITALVLCYSIGMITFLAMIGLSLLGIIYSIHLFPVSLRQKIPYSKIKDIPGSRSLSESLAWAAVIAVLPLLEKFPLLQPAALVCIFIVLSISYVRSALFDILQAQGDLIVGTETLPIILGEKKALDLLKALLLAAALLVIVSPVLGIVGPFSFCILFPLFSLAFCLKAYEKHWLYPGITFEVLVEGIFFLTGFLALIWQAMGWPL
jgi:4-hydroxy-3-methylbut-2-enyl diphosphate reductase